MCHKVLKYGTFDGLHIGYLQVFRQVLYVCRVPYKVDVRDV